MSEREFPQETSANEIPNLESPREQAPAEARLQPQPESPRGRGLFWGLLGGCLLILVVLIISGAVLSWLGNDESFLTGQDKVAIVLVDGEILDARATIEALHRHAENRAIKAMVIRINSPGGAIVPSQEIFQEIRRVRAESKKPIVASMDSVAASGGYYIAAACDHIIANPGSITGSIGVIFEWFNIEDLLKWAHLKPQTITSGRLKSAGSPFRGISEEEKAYFQKIVSQLHRQFVRAVAEGRKGKLTEEQVILLADGRIFTGEEAKELRLIDELGNLQDAILVAGKLAGIRGTPTPVYPKPEKEGLIDLLSEMKSTSGAIERVLQSRANPFAYRW